LNASIFFALCPFLFSLLELFFSTIPFLLRRGAVFGEDCRGEKRVLLVAKWSGVGAGAVFCDC